MKLSTRWAPALAAALVVLGGVLPPLLYWLAWGSVPAVMPAEALRMLNAPGAQAVLVDVRSPDAYERTRIEGASSLPAPVVLSIQSADGLPGELAGKTLLLLGENGLDSARAAAHLRSMGTIAVFNVRGGMQAWPKAARRAEGMRYSAFTAPGQPAFLPTQAMTPLEQAAQVAAGFLVKPLYTIGSLLLGILLLRENAPDLKALRRGLFAFFSGELFCYINFLAFGDDSYLSEFLHSYGMVVGFAFIFYALMEGVERRLLHFDDINKRCGLAGVCLQCSHYSKITCRVQRAAQLLLPVLALLALIPLAARIDSSGYNSMVGEFPYYFARFAVYQVYENRLLPWAALACFAAAYVPLWLYRVPPIPALTRVFTAAGLGALAFSLFRLTLGSVYATNLVWFNFWEETTELVFILAIAAGLWLFRVNLFPRGLPRWAVRLFSQA